MFDCVFCFISICTNWQIFQHSGGRELASILEFPPRSNFSHWRLVLDLQWQMFPSLLQQSMFTAALRMEEERAQKTGMIAYCLIFNNLDRRPFLEPAGLQLHIKIIISQHFILWPLKCLYLYVWIFFLIYYNDVYSQTRRSSKWFPGSSSQQHQMACWITGERGKQSIKLMISCRLRTRAGRLDLRRVTLIYA